MRRIHLLCIALLSTCVVGVLSPSAFALNFVLAEWLKNGVAITAKESATTEGEFRFENTLSGAAILCSILFEGSVSPNGVDEVTKIFNLNNTEIKELDATGTSGLVCSSIDICEANPEIWPVNLPFKTLLDLDETEEEWFDRAIANGAGLLPAYLILCKDLGLNIEELCEAATLNFGEVINAATDVETIGAVSPRGTCNGNAADALIENNSENKALIALLVGNLSVSN